MSEKTKGQLFLAVIWFGVSWGCINLLEVLLGVLTPIDLPTIPMALVLAGWPWSRSVLERYIPMTQMSEKTRIQLFLAIIRFLAYWLCINLLEVLLGVLTPIDLPTIPMALVLAGWPWLWLALEHHIPLTQIFFGKNQQPLEPMEIVGLALYGDALFLELIPTGLRFGVCLALISFLGVLTPIDLPATPISFLLAGWPLLWSALALRFPGRGDYWQRRAGARRPSLQDAERIYECMPNPPDFPSETLKLECSVIDDALRFEGALGGATVVSSGLIDADYFEAVLDHAFWHIRTLDARLSEAFRRMGPWEDPLAPAEGVKGAAVADHNYRLVRWLRWLLVGAGGGFGPWALDLPLSWYWREREFAADAAAVSSNNGPGIVASLEEEKGLTDRPRPRLVAGGRYKHPAPALRKERIFALEEGREITWKTELCLSSNFLTQFFVRVNKMSDPFAESHFAH
jgi:hypothetical protein